MLQVCVKLRKEIGLTENQFEEARRGSNQLENFSLNKAYGRLGIDETLRDPASRTRVLTALESMLQLTIRRTNESDQPIKFDAKHQVIDIDRVKQTESIVKKDSDELVILGEIDLKSIEQLRDEAEGGDDTEDMGDGLE